MYTQCPSCKVIFAMTEDDHDAHQGLVRCGRCREVFNASWNLVDSIPNQQPVGLRSETIRPAEETLATPEITAAGVDEIPLVDADADALTESPAEELERDHTPNDAGTDNDSVYMEADFDLDVAREPPTSGPVTEPDVDEDEGMNGSLSVQETDLVADTAGAPEADINGQDEPEAAGMEEASELSPADSSIGVETEAPQHGPAHRESDDDMDSSVLDEIEWDSQTDAVKVESVLEEVEPDADLAESFTAMDTTGDVILDETDEAAATETGMEDADADIDDEVALAEVEEVTVAEEMAMGELDSLLAEEVNGEESILFEQEVEAEDSETILPSANELSLDELNSSTTEKSVEDEATIITGPENLDADVYAPTDEGMAAETLDNAAGDTLIPVDAEPTAQSEVKAAEDASDSPSITEDKAADAQHSRADQPSTPASMFPDVEPEEIIIEAPTKLWKIGEDPSLEVENAAAEAAASAQIGPIRGKRKSQPKRAVIPYSVRLLAWSLGSILLLFGLIWQVKDHYLDDLAQMQSLREPLNQMCKYLWCTVPPRTDIKAIDLVGTNVDPHPVTPGALRVSASLINRADFEQQFPPLEITLTDKEGSIVGRRTYLPHEYRGEAPDRMLPNVLERAIFDLAQPAESAVGYEIQLVAR